jgi:uncharacterized membrane protein
MKLKNIFRNVFLFVFIVWSTQHLLIHFIPQIVFVIGKYRSQQPLNTVIHAGKTDATLRKVVLPNPDFIYSACFFDLTKNDLMISGEFPDTAKYCSLAFYGDNVQPFYVINNLQGFGKKYNVRLSGVHRTPNVIQAKSKQGVILMRLLITDSFQIDSAKKFQKKFSVKEVSIND